MKAWAVQDAKARFSELLVTCIQQGPQVVTYRGEEKAILVPMEEWKRLQAVNKPTLKEVLLSAKLHFEMNIPQRGFKKHRLPVNFQDE